MSLPRIWKRKARSYSLMLMRIARQISELSRDIKLEHSLFALPFGLIGAMAAVRARPAGANIAGILPEGRILLLILIAMISARTAAMTFNRLADAPLDRENPRTRDRAIPAGRLSRPVALGAVVAMAGIFLLSAYLLNPLAFILSPVALIVILGYSYTKRFTSLSHIVLGLALSMAPAGAYIAVTGSLATAPLLLSAAVVTWVAGFDILYSLADVEFDQGAGLRSIPASLGPAPAMRISGLLHLSMILLLSAFGLLTGSGGIYYLGAAAAAVLLVMEHRIVTPDNLDNLPRAFFTINAWIGGVVLAFYTLDILV